MFAFIVIMQIDKIVGVFLEEIESKIPINSLEADCKSCSNSQKYEKQLMDHINYKHILKTCKKIDFFLMRARLN